MTPKERAKNALEFIIPILEKYGFRWVITGGFACYAYGVPREITDIDIDIEGSKDDEKFKQFYTELAPQMSQPLIHFVDKNYDNYNFEITVEGIVIDICPMKEMCVIDKSSGSYLPFYADRFPESELVGFQGMQLSLLSKELIIKNKEMLAFQKPSDFADISGLRKLMEV